MLILSRKIGQSIVIEGGIVIKVLAMEGYSVRLGIEAPRELRVDRDEIALQRIAAAKAAQHTTPEAP